MVDLNPHPETPARQPVDSDDKVPQAPGAFREVVGKLPVPHIKESHERSVKISDVTAAGASAVVPPYQAMRVGDEVIFSWQGYFQGVPEPVYQESKQIRAEHLQQPLTFTVPYIEIRSIEGEHADISYRVEYAEQPSQPSESEQQRIDIVDPGSALLPSLSVKGHTAGPINPGHYPDGLTLQVKPLYLDIQENDWVLLYWTGSEKAKSVTKALRVDRSTVDSGLFEFYIEPHWLTVNSNAQVKVLYQYARAGVARSAEPLLLEISKPLHLPPPIIEDVTPGADNHGTWAATTNGAYVNVPDTAEIGTGNVEVHWQGHPNGGRHIATVPVSGRRFHIPATAIAANMSTLAQGRYFPVFYSVEGEPSVHFNLLVTPLPATRYPATTSEHITGGRMHLSEVPFSGADLVIESPGFDAWPFMAQGQLLTMEATAAHLSYPVRNARPVTEAEFRNKKITAKLPKREFLESLQNGEEFSLTARVSFDGGETFTPFRDVMVTLVR
ncbi:hypothetical protein [Pseudomonas citrulli]|uniref:Uncharacterized protein n=1 Tax=Pseudomonas citrulli TaxID=3064347 RepID=A0ABT9C660_9PSED|nr:hypothetical protein [Pseudomonas sp. K18]MDO7900289.1 hypothetical protein [Pseudomonas sp. K18]